MRASRWAILSCLLCLAAASPTSGCSWQYLHKQEVTKVPSQIDVRSKNGNSGELHVTLVLQNGLKSVPHATKISSQHHSVALHCEETKCCFEVRQNNTIINNGSNLATDGFKKFEVTGDNLEWCRNTVGKPKDGGDDGDNSDGNEEESDKKPPLWVLALVAAGVAVTVASISVFVWTLCRACKGEGRG